MGFHTSRHGLKRNFTCQTAGLLSFQPHSALCTVCSAVRLPNLRLLTSLLYPFTGIPSPQSFRGHSTDHYKLKGKPRLPKPQLTCQDQPQSIHKPKDGHPHWLNMTCPCPGGSHHHWVQVGSRLSGAHHNACSSLRTRSAS